MPDRMMWEVPDDEDLGAGIRANDEAELEDRIRRYRFISTEFGPPTDMFLVGGVPAMLAIYDLQRSFINGNFLSTVLTAQAFIEHTLGASFAIAGHDDIAPRSFTVLIDKAVECGRVTPELGANLHELRKFRNPYAHHREVMSKHTLIQRMVEGEEPTVEAQAEADARRAIEIVVDFLRMQSPRWRPGNEGELVYTLP